MHFRAGGGAAIDPTPLGEAAQLQYMSNPGPNEVSNNRSILCLLSAKRAPGTIVGREFILSRAVPRGMQLLQWYGADWFSSRDIKRMDVGCSLFPAERKRGREIARRRDERRSERN